MKKLILIYTLLLFGFVNAQFMKYGVTANFNKGSIAGIHGVSKGNFGGSIGVFADISIVPNDIYDSAWLYFTPQLEFTMLGERGDWNEDEKDMQKYNNSYIAVPLYIKYFLKSQGYKGDLYFFAGPKFEFLVAEKKEEGNSLKQALDAGFSNPKQQFGLDQKIATFGYGLSIGVGVKVQEKLDVYLRFDRGFSKIYPDYKDATYNRFLAVGISYYIGETN